MAVLIAVEAPTGTKPPPSFLSKDLNADWKEITLQEIRKRCRISGKHAFSVNGKNPIDCKKFTLDQYVGLTEENQKAITEATNGKTATVVIKVISLSESVEKNLDQSNLRSDLKNLLEKPGEGIHGELGDASKLLGDLTSLKEDYAAKTSKLAYTEPADLTERQWENILFNNRMLHGYYYDSAKSVLVRAPRRAFAVRRPSRYADPSDAEIAVPVAPNTDKLSEAANSTDRNKNMNEYLNVLPGIPSFYVDDDSTVSVVELHNAFQRKMANQGFSHDAIEANAAAKPFGRDLSFSASWSEEESHDQKSSTESGDTTLQVRYSFPRVVVDLSPEYLELSDECYRDIQQLSEESKPQFERKYGHTFPTRIVLGGSLNSTRKVTINNISDVEAHKEQIKEAAGLSFAAPQYSFGITQARVNSNTATEGIASSEKTSQLTWEARGGDTVLCSNPPEWATTVKNYQYWRVISQSHNVHLNAAIRSIDSVLSGKLDYPGIENEDSFIEGLSDIIDGDTTSERAKYLEKTFDALNSLDQFNAWLKQNTMEKLIVREGKKWFDLEKDDERIGREQKIQFGTYLLKVKGIDVTTIRPY